MGDQTLRLGVLLSGGGRTLLNLLDKIHKNKLDADVVCVIASRECKGIQRCRDAGLQVHLIPYAEMQSTRAYSAAILELLDKAKVDLVLQAGFLSFWEVPERYLGRVMNIHPALLPAFGGKGMYGDHVHCAVLAHGCKISGCTVHFVTNEYDNGPIIIQRSVPVYDTDTPDDLASRVFEQECIAYPEAIRLFQQGRLKIDGRIVRVKQSDENFL